MIKEIVQFIDALPAETFSRSLQLKEGLYMFLDVQEENGKAVLKNVDEEGNLKQEDFIVFKIGNEDTPLVEKCRRNTVFIDPVSSNKAWNRSIFGLSCNPFALCFKKEHYIDEKKYSENFVKNAIEEYFKNSKKYWQKTNYKDEILCFQEYLKNNLWDLLEKFQPFQKLGKKNVYIFKKCEDYKFEEQYNFYLKEKIFNKDAYNQVDENDVLWGISDDLSTFADKKIFLKHHSALFDLNTRVTGKDAILINRFMKMDIPKPIPIFIDQDELNQRIFSLYSNEDKKSYREIIKGLYENRSEDLQNYYLLFWTTTKKGRKILDLDFIPRFQFYVRKTIENIFEIKNDGEVLKDFTINNVFDLEFNISSLIFSQENNITGNSKPILFKQYFSDKIQADKGSFISEATLSNLYKFRKAWYNYIYKSRHNEITCSAFDEMMEKSILENIKLDDQRKNDKTIKRKLNLWFSLYTHFNQNQNREDMANKTVELRDELRAIIENENLNIKTDSQFAFASGQLIWKILIQSKSANRSHALLEPFLQKSSVEQFKLAIANTFDMYKHEFTLYPKKYGFDKLMGDVMGFIPDEKNMKNLLTYILAGYFSESLLQK